MSFVDGDGHRRSARNLEPDADVPPEPPSNNQDVLDDALSLNESISEAQSHSNTTADLSIDNIPPADSTVDSNSSRRISTLQNAVQSLQAQLDQQRELRAMELQTITNVITEQYERFRTEDRERYENRHVAELQRIDQLYEGRFEAIINRLEANFTNRLDNLQPPVVANPNPIPAPPPQAPPRRVPSEPPEDVPQPSGSTRHPPPSVPSSTSQPSRQKVALDPPEAVSLPSPPNPPIAAAVVSENKPKYLPDTPSFVEQVPSTVPATSTTPSPAAASSDTAALLAKLITPKALTFAKFTNANKKDFDEYRSRVYLAIRKHSAYKHLVVKNGDGELGFPSVLSDDDNSTLYTSTIDAFQGFCRELYITAKDNKEADGLKLWRRLETHFLKKTESELHDISLKETYNTLSRNPSEELFSWFTRFREKVLELEQHDVDVGSTINQAVRMLRSSNAIKVYEEIILTIENPNKNMEYRDYSLVDFIELAKKEYQTKLRISSDYASPAVKPKPNKPPAPKPTPVIESPYKKKVTDAPTAQETAEKERLRFREDIIRADNKESILKTWHRLNSTTCPFHPNLSRPHPFLKCRHTITHCKEAGASTLLQSIQTEFLKNDTSSTPTKNQQEMATMRKMMTEVSNGLKTLQESQIQLSATQQQMLSSIFEDRSGGEDAEEIDDKTKESVNQYLPFCSTSSPLCSSFPSRHTSLRLKPQFRRVRPTTPIEFQEKCNYVFNSRTLDDSKLPNIHKAVIDSGATHTMTAIPSLFESITYYNKSTCPKVLMGDDKTTLQILGYGYITFKVHGHVIRLFSYYVPRLGTTLISAKQHMKSKGCFFHVEAQETSLAYPSFIIYPSVHHEIELLLTKAPSNSKIDFDEEKSTKVNIEAQSKSTSNLVSQSVYNFIPKYTDHHPFTKSVYFKKLVPQATIPTQGTKGSIGFDISCIQQEIIQPGEIRAIPTGLSSSFDNGIYMRIAPRSSLSLQHLTVEGGVVDSDYRGEIKVLIKNNSDKPFSFTSGQRIAQLIFEQANIPLVHTVTTLPQSSRQGGFGSTGTMSSSPALQYGKKIHSKKAFYNLKEDEYIIINPKKKYHQRVRIGTTLPAESSSSSQTTDPTESSTALPIVITNIDYSTTPSAPNDCFQMHHPRQGNVSQTNQTNHTTSSSTTPTSSASPHSDTTIIDTPYHPSVNHALPKTVNMSHRNFLRSIGYRKPHKLLNQLKFLGQDNFKVQDDEYVHDVLDPGDVATLPKGNFNNEPSPLPQNYNDVWHIDIGFGPKMGIGGIKYCLMAIDKKTRYRLVYGLKNLTSSLESAIKQFIIDCGSKPKLVRTDFDPKLNQGRIAAIFKKEEIKIQSAPPARQDQNGLVERHWQTVVSMARRWLKASLLPSDYWYLAIKRACEVCNILPTNHIEKTITTPYELVFNKKVDYRELFPMFSVAYIKQMRQAGHIKTKWEDQSLKCIAVGQCPLSNALLFYHPPSKQMITCGTNYKFDTTIPAGPHFKLSYDGNFYMCLQSTLESEIHRPPSHEQGSTKFYKETTDGVDSYHKVHILNIPVNEEGGIYTVQMDHSGDIVQCTSSELYDSDPNAPIPSQPSTQAFQHLPWIQHKTKATLYLQDRMQDPKQGYLIVDESTNTWQFSIGRNLGNRPTIPLPDFESTAASLLANKKLFKGWKTKNFVLNARAVRATSNIISGLIKCNKVSAQGLHDMRSPSSLLRHDKLHPDDKIIWDKAYEHEYRGLENIDTWETISEDEYNKIKHLSKGLLPTMAISTIKFDGDGNPTRAKYRIVALGNLDPNNWSKQDCFAPVLSQFELRLLCALAARNGCIPKTGDVTQAFCQSYLPPEEVYVLKPPAGCPLTPPNSYWKLKKTLYGLRRSPRHFYLLAKKILLQIGFIQHPTSPCLFYGTLIEGEPPIYLGLYVDDFIYFSKSRKVEEKFEKKFGELIDTDFNGDIDYFLGIKFTHHKDATGNVTINLSQEAFIDHLCHQAGLGGDAINTVSTPYKSGFPVDSIPKLTDDNPDSKIVKTMQSYIGSLNWLATSTRPDLCTITNMLAKYVSIPTKQHIDYVKRIIKYIKGSKNLGISFATISNKRLNAHIKFPISEDSITALSDANWGPQDQSRPLPNETRQLDLFKTRSVSGYLLWFCGPLHWQSKRQTITARSSAEAEIYATDECAKCLQHLLHLTDGLLLTNDVFDTPTIIYNDNAACVQWSKNTTTKGLRHIQIRENAVRELVQEGFITIKHIEGKVNLSDMFTKEDKSADHFIGIRDVVLSDNRLHISDTTTSD